MAEVGLPATLRARLAWTPATADAGCSPDREEGGAPRASRRPLERAPRRLHRVQTFADARLRGSGAPPSHRGASRRSDRGRTRLSARSISERRTPRRSSRPTSPARASICKPGPVGRRASSCRGTRCGSNSASGEWTVSASGGRCTPRSSSPVTRPKQVCSPGWQNVTLAARQSLGDDTLAELCRPPSDQVGNDSPDGRDNRSARAIQPTRDVVEHLASGARAWWRASWCAAARTASTGARHTIRWSGPRVDLHEGRAGPQSDLAGGPLVVLSVPLVDGAGGIVERRIVCLEVPASRSSRRAGWPSRRRRAN